MSDYIKREDAVIEIERFGGYLDDDMLYRIKLALNRLPSADVVKVVRCKKCKFWDSDCIWCDLWGNTQEYYDGYCNYGERKDNE